MGLDRRVTLPGEPPSWEAVRVHLARVGPAPSVVMIDGLPAFPDEVPEPGWSELRLRFPAGMVTLRRAAGGLSCVVWGNADAALLAARDALAWAVAAAGGQVDTPAGPLGADEFARSVGLSPS